jgi:hypothetical protein
LSVTRTTFEKMNGENNLRHVKTRHSIRPGIDLIVSEGYRLADKEMPSNHWLLTWALTRGEDVLETMPVRVPSYVRMPESLVEVATVLETRIEICEEAAEKWLINSKEAGWIN